MAWDVSDSLDHVVVIVRGMFDEAEADRLCAALHAIDPGRPLVVDFRDVQFFHDCAVVRLASELARVLRLRPALIGLYEHHYRLLRYFGLAEILSPAQRSRPGERGSLSQLVLLVLGQQHIGGSLAQDSGPDAQDIPRAGHELGDHVLRLLQTHLGPQATCAIVPPPEPPPNPPAVGSK